MNYKKTDAKAAARRDFRGVWAAITTPFEANGDVDEAGVRALMRYLIDELSISGVFCTGVMGEFWSLTIDEWKKTIEVVVEEAGGGCGVIAHTGHHSLRQTLDLTQHAQKVGADYAIAAPPYVPKPTSSQAIVNWFKYVTDNTDIGLWLFDTHFLSGELTVDLIDELADIDNIVGIKVARPLDYYHRVNEVAGDRLVLSHPSESDLLRLVRDEGMQVHMSSAAPFLLQVPESPLINDYMNAAFDGSYEQAEDASDRLTSARRLTEDWVWKPYREQGAPPIAYVKAWCEEMGLPGGPPRPPLDPITAAQREALRRDLVEVGLAKTGSA